MLEVFTFSQYWSSALRMCIELGWGHWDACVGGLGNWGRETKDLGTSSMGRGDVWDRDRGR